MHRWTTLLPPVALGVLVLASLVHSEAPVAIGVVALFLVASVLAAVHHAEVVAHWAGDPFGSLILAVSVTVIEVALIVTLMINDPVHAATLARDTVFAAVMLSLNGIVGISLLVGALRHHLAAFNPEGTGSALATVITLAGLTLVLPRFTTSSPGPAFTAGQLAFAAVVSLALYAFFVATQAGRHREFFVPEGEPSSGTDHEPPARSDAWRSLALLAMSLVAVVGLAELESKPLEKAVGAAGLPHEVVGVVIAALVLLPEAVSAVIAAADDRAQVSFNLAYGSVMASIGLTIPAVALAKIWLDRPLSLGLPPTGIVLLVLTAVVSILTVVPGRAKPLQGALHLMLLATFVFVSINP